MRRFELLLAIRRIGLLLTNLDVDSRPTQYCGPSSLTWDDHSATSAPKLLGVSLYYIFTLS